MTYTDTQRLDWLERYCTSITVCTADGVLSIHARPGATLRQDIDAATPKLSLWFPGTQNPWVPGVYEIQSVSRNPFYRGVPQVFGFSYWADNYWHGLSKTADEAILRKDHSTVCEIQEFTWRGLDAPMGDAS